MKFYNRSNNATVFSEKKGVVSAGAWLFLVSVKQPWSFLTFPVFEYHKVIDYFALLKFQGRLMRLLYNLAKIFNIWERFIQIATDILRISHSYTSSYFISFRIV